MPKYKILQQSIISSAYPVIVSVENVILPSSINVYCYQCDKKNKCRTWKKVKMSAKW